MYAFLHLPLHVSYKYQLVSKGQCSSVLEGSHTPQLSGRSLLPTKVHPKGRDSLQEVPKHWNSIVKVNHHFLKKL